MATQRGYRAIADTTTYEVESQSGGKLIVLQNGQTVVQESAIGPVITANKPEAGSNLRLTCTGGITNRNLYFTVVYTSAGGFTTFEVRQKGSDRLISSGNLSLSEKNSQGQTTYRGAAKDADVVVIGAAPHAQSPLSDLSFSLDGQRGRGTCRPVS